MSKIKLSGPLISLNFKKIKRKYISEIDDYVFCEKLQTSKLITSVYYKPISNLCIII